MGRIVPAPIHEDSQAPPRTAFPTPSVRVPSPTSGETARTFCIRTRADPEVNLWRESTGGLQWIKLPSYANNAFRPAFSACCFGIAHRAPKTLAGPHFGPISLELSGPRPGFDGFLKLGSGQVLGMVGLAPFDIADASHIGLPAPIPTLKGGG